MSRSQVTTMTIPQAVELLRDTSPQDATAEQIGGLRDLVARTPTCLPLLGGRSRVDLFLEEATRSMEPTRTAEAVLLPLGDDPIGSQPSSTGASPGSGYRQRHLLELGLLLGGLLIFLSGMCFYLFGFGSLGSWWHSSPSTTATSHQKLETTASERKVSSQKPERNKSLLATEIGTPTDAEGDGAWKGWKFEGSPGAITVTKTVWNLDNPTKPEAATVMVLGAKPAKLTAEKQIDDASRWLRIELVVAEAPATGTIEILADGKSLSRVKLEPAHIGTPLLVSLDAIRGRKANLEFRFEPESTTSAVAVKELTLSSQSTRVPWTALKPVAVEAGSGAKLSVLPDDSVLASGSNAGIEQYDVTVTLPSGGASAIRLDALPDASLPEQGPGRGQGGLFLVRRFTAVRTASVRKLDQVPARHVRIELLGPKRALTLAEVEVFSGGENVAKKKPATQSSTVYGCAAGRAVDGNTQNEFRKGRGSITHTSAEINPWWSVDLQQEYPVEKIVVWNRGDGCEQELANHRVVVTDGRGAKSWQQDHPFPPVPNITYGPFILEEERIPLTAVAVDSSKPDADPTGMIRDDAPATSGWTGRGASSTSTAVFTLGQPVPGGEQVTFHLMQGSPPQGLNLGRFRLWSTTALAPHQSEPAVIVLPSTSPTGAN